MDKKGWEVEWDEKFIQVASSYTVKTDTSSITLAFKGNTNELKSFIRSAISKEVNEKLDEAVKILQEAREGNESDLRSLIYQVESLKNK